MSEKNTKVLAVAGKGGVGKTSIAAVMVKLLTQMHPGKKILAIDADPAVGLSTALGIEVKLTIDDIRKEVVSTIEDGDIMSHNHKSQSINCIRIRQKYVDVDKGTVAIRDTAKIRAPLQFGRLPTNPARL